MPERAAATAAHGRGRRSAIPVWLNEQGRFRRAGIAVPAKAAYVVPILLGVQFGCCSAVALSLGTLNLANPIAYVLSVLFSIVFCVVYAWVYAALEKRRCANAHAQRAQVREGGSAHANAQAAREGGSASVRRSCVGADASSTPARANSGGARPAVRRRTSGKAASCSRSARARRRGSRSAFGRFFLSSSSPLLRWDVLGIVLTGTLIFACWLPWLLAMCPGVFWADTANQVAWALNDYWKILAQHPLFDTLIMGWFAQLGLDGSGNAFTGIYALVLIQSAACAFSLGALCCYLNGKLRLSRTAAVVAFAFCALFYPLPTFMGTLAKDTLSLPFFILFALAYVECMRTRGASLRHPGWLVLLCASALLLALTKKPGLYIVCLCAVFAIASVRGWRAKSVWPALSIVVVLCANLLMPAIVTGPLNRQIVPDGREEALALPMQQLANAVRHNPQSFDAADRAIVDQAYFMGFAGIPDAYNWMCADGVKRYSEPEGADYGAFLKLWAEEAPANALAYVEAWDGLVADWFTFGPTPDLVFNFYSGEINEEFMALQGYEPEAAAAGALEAITGVLGYVPGMSILVGKALWASVVPGFCLFAILARGRGERGRRFSLLMPFVGTFLFLLVGPVSIWNEGIRYVMPLVATAPLSLAIAFWTPRAEGKQAAEGTGYQRRPRD